jgi:hypothetical protein
MIAVVPARQHQLEHEHLHATEKKIGGQGKARLLKSWGKIRARSAFSHYKNDLTIMQKICSA